LYDVKNNQKISENFYCIPNYDLFFSQLTKNTKSNSKLSNNNNQNNNINHNKISSSLSKNSTSSSSQAMFSLDGNEIFETIQSLLNHSHLTKRNHINRIKKVILERLTTL
jgi:hypothetical protein